MEDREDIRAAVRRDAKRQLAASGFGPDTTPVPVSGQVLDPEDLPALGDASFDGWLTTGRVHLLLECALAGYAAAREAGLTTSMLDVLADTIFQYAAKAAC